jgi:hypothetical protein
MQLISARKNPNAAKKYPCAPTGSLWSVLKKGDRVYVWGRRSGT